MSLDPAAELAPIDLAAFTGNIIQHLIRDVLRERGRFVSAALTIVRAWIAAGRPKTDCKPLGSYDEWSELCCQPLLWLGCADPVASVFEAMAEDPDRETLARLLSAWQAVFGNTAAMIREAINKSNLAFEDHQELREVRALETA